MKAFLARLLERLVADLPDTIAACETDCRVKVCPTPGFLACERRRRVAAGLLAWSPFGPADTAAPRRVRRHHFPPGL